MKNTTPKTSKVLTSRQKDMSLWFPARLLRLPRLNQHESRLLRSRRYLRLLEQGRPKIELPNMIVCSNIVGPAHQTLVLLSPLITVHPIGQWHKLNNKYNRLYGDKTAFLNKLRTNPVTSPGHSSPRTRVLMHTQENLARKRVSRVIRA